MSLGSSTACLIDAQVQPRGRVQLRHPFPTVECWSVKLRTLTSRQPSSAFQGYGITESRVIAEVSVEPTLIAREL